MSESGKIKTQTDAVSVPAQERAASTTPGQKRRYYVILNEKSFDRAVNKAYELTDWNNHNEALQVFSKYFKYDDITKGLQDNLKAHNKAGYLTPELGSQRDALMNDMFERIRQDYGEEVLRKVKKGL